MEIALPPLFESRLAANKALRAGVDKTLEDFTIWFGESKLPFFTDYTDHGLKHIQGVVQTLNGLITPQSFEIISSADVAILIVTTLLHDSALHLSEAGFKQLIHGQASDRLIDELDSEKWIDLWEGYLYSARRWDDSKLRSVFGDDAFAEGNYSVEDPFTRYANLQETDRRLIGEFIRIHHPRIAHEFALYGVPGPAGSDPTKLALENDFADIAGIVARSHGMSMRPCIDYLTTRGYDKRTYRELHVPYLMCLIRVADYLQIDSNRAPHANFRYKHIPSPQSRLEWEVHNSISNIHTAGDDPESIHVYAMPRTVLAFLRLREWLNGIQIELDASWAVLGEVYGRIPQFNALGLTLRRVRSNLDDLSTFKPNVEYVPTRVELDVARAELLKILIAPLYGDDKPQMGVRELVQNAVDAVRERTQLNGTIGGEAISNDFPDADVLVIVGRLMEDETAWLTVQDRGIGMTEEVIKTHFLRAGASFRRSEIWQKTFEDGDLPGSGSRVIRSGRFGVGALAAFLLGDEIQVETRHVYASEGFRFSVRISQEPISLIRDANLVVGTTIRVRINRECHEQLSKANSTTKIPSRLGWYLFSWPQVVRIYEGEKSSRFEKGGIPASSDGQPSDWLEVPFDGEYKCYTSYDTGVPALTCNGIWVTNSQSWQRFRSHEMNHSYYHPNFPKIAISDPNAKFPMTLTRDSVALDAYPFEGELVESVVRDWFSYLIAKTPAVRPFSSRDLPIYFPAWPPSISQVLNGRLGILPYDAKLICNIGPKTVAYFFREKFPVEVLAEHDLVMFQRWKGKVDESAVASMISGDASASFLKIDERIVGVRALVRDHDGGEWVAKPDNNEFIFSKVRKSPFGTIADKLQMGFEGFTRSTLKSGWSLVESKGCPRSLIEFDTLTNLRTPAVIFVEQFIHTPDAHTLPANLISRLWDEVIGFPYIPYDVAKRRSELKKAYSVLGDRISYYESKSIFQSSYWESVDTFEDN